jgi:hypothetical protein
MKRQGGQDLAGVSRQRTDAPVFLTVFPVCQFPLIFYVLLFLPTFAPLFVPRLPQGSVDHAQGDHPDCHRN